MSKTFVQINAELPTGSLKRVADFLADAQKIGADHKASRFLFTINGGDNETSGNATELPGNGMSGGSGGGGGGSVGRGRSEAAERAAQDFADDAEADAAEPAGTAEPAKRRGRPPGSGKRGAEASGAASGQRDGADGRGTASGGAAQGSGGDEPVGTRQGAGQGSGKGQGGRGGAGGGGNAQRGTSQAPRISTGEDRGEADASDWDDDTGGTSDSDWDDAAPDVGSGQDAEWWCKTPDEDGWPDHLMPEGELTADTLAVLAGEHHAASGAKDRTGTMVIIKAHSGGVPLPKAHPDTFDAIARALLRDTAKYTYGVKKPAK